MKLLLAFALGVSVGLVIATILAMNILIVDVVVPGCCYGTVWA